LEKQDLFTRGLNSNDVDAASDTEGKVIAIAYCCFYKLPKLHGQGRIVNRFNDKGKRDCASLEAVFNRHSRNACGRESSF
jgi:hypothetical protein